MINKKQINIPMQDKKAIYAYIWSSTEVIPTKSIVLCHGMAEHIDRYEEFVHKLTQNGFIVLGYNQRGHKYTSEKSDYGYMGDTNNFNILVSDLNEMVEYLNSEYNLPIYVFGHSMGSFVSTRFIELYGNKVKGVVLSGTGKNPSIILNLGAFMASLIKLFKGEHFRSKFINNLSFGSFNKAFKPNRTEYDWLNTDETEVDKYVNDEWCGGIFTVTYFKDFFKGCVKINKNIKRIPFDLPILIISGGNDPVGNMGKGTTSVYNSLIKTEHKNIGINLIENARHEILLEKKKDSVHSTIIDWLSNN